MPISRWLLRLCPAELRREYGRAMEETLRRRLADARRDGAWRYARVWLRECVGLVILAWSERLGAARYERRRRQAHAERKAGHMDRLGLEFRHAARRLLLSPAFTLASVLTLALAIGANGAIFAVVQRVVLNPLPYPDSDRLIAVQHGAQRLNLPAGMGITRGLYYHYAERARTLAGIGLYQTQDVTLTGLGDPERIRIARATPSTGAVVGVAPALGRWFRDDEGNPGAADVAVLSHGLWMRRYGSNPNVLGESIVLSGVPATIVGVMPASYALPDARIDAWMALQINRAMGFGIWSYNGVARLRDTATIADAQAEMNALIADVPNAFPGDPFARGNATAIGLISVPQTVKEATIGGVARALWIVLAAVALVLLVACANVANLFLVRSETRQREIAVRRALGAGRLGIARYFLTESVLLSLAGGAVGVAIAWSSVRLLVRFGPATLPRINEIQLDAVGVTFTFAISLLAALAFGALPLWRSAPLAASLHENGRGNTANRNRHQARRLLMSAQVALALVLLVSSGLMLRSFQKLRAIDPGFDPASTLTFSVGLPDREYKDRAAAVAAHQAIVDRLAAVPGVRAAAAGTCLPLTVGACFGNTVRVEGRAIVPNAPLPLAIFQATSGGFFDAMGMRLIRGRPITRDDVDRKEPVVVIDQAFADQVFPKQDPINQRVASSRPGDLTWLTIVGIVSSTAQRALAEPTPIAKVYMPMSIAGGPGIPQAALVGPNTAVMSFVVRTVTPPHGLVPALRQAVDGVDPRLALAQVRTLQDIFDGASAQMAFTMTLLAIAAGVALLLGMIGIYGVMSYIVSQRTGEIGVRLALGAEPGSVAGMIVRQGGLATVAGIVVGLAGAFAGSRLIGSLLYGISPRDPIVFAATTVVLFTVALAACWLPARRAARLSPLEALRTE